MFEFVPVVIKNALRRPATRNYPKVVRAPYAQQRGHIVIDLPNCIYCGMCARKCPVGAIEVKRPDRQWSIDRFNCIMCGECTRCCPKKCLSMGPEYAPVAGKQTADVFKMPPEPPKAPAPKVEPAKAVEPVKADEPAKEETRGA